MRQSPFFTAIARRYDARIEEVIFCKLEPGKFGMVQRKRQADEYRILIDDSQWTCPWFSFYALFHEIGHVKGEHFQGWASMNIGTVCVPELEKEADDYAFHEMGFVKEEGRMNPETACCAHCIKTRSRTCLKAV